MKKTTKKWKTTDSPAYLKQAPVGVPGDITRTDESNVEPIMLVGVGSSPTVYPPAMGVPLKYVTGGAQQFNGGAETKASFAGVLTRAAPAIAPGSDTTFGTTPWEKQVQGLLVRGYVSVLCTYGTPVRSGIVYIRIVANGNGAVGAFEATSDGGNNIALDAVQAEWATDGKDADNNAELRVAR